MKKPNDALEVLESVELSEDALVEVVGGAADSAVEGQQRISSGRYCTISAECWGFSCNPWGL